jgi:glycosyltransferase involved in cell wall biosynthesis
MRFASSSKNRPSNRPPIVIDVTRLMGRYQQGRLPTGVDRVSLAYVAHFRERAVAKANWRGFSGLISPALSVKLFDALIAWQLTPQALHEFRAWLRQGAWSALAQVHWRGQWLFNTSHQGLESARYARDLWWHAHRPVFFLHDLIPLSHPQYCREGEALKHRARLNNMLTWGRGLILNSQDTAEHLHTYAQQAGLKVPPVLVAPLAPAMAAWPAAQESSPVAKPPYFLAIGTIEPRKNMALLIQVWRSLVQELGAQAPQLIVVGQAGWESESVMQQLNDAHAWQGRLLWLQNCTDAQLHALLRDARALLFPSFVEGYGMPVVEALQKKLPVLASDLKVLREFAAEIPDYLPTSDPQSWKEAVMAFASPHSQRREAQLERMDGFVPNTWARHFLQVDDFLQTLESLKP